MAMEKESNGSADMMEQVMGRHSSEIKLECFRFALGAASVGVASSVQMEQVLKDAQVLYAWVSGSQS
jgi:hypothetical protein